MKIFLHVLALSVMHLAVPALAQTPAASEEKPPQILLQALHCLSDDDGWMRSYLRTHKVVHVSFSINTTNPPESLHWTIVVREADARGHFFEVARVSDHGITILRLLDSDGFTAREEKLEFDQPRLFHAVRGDHTEGRVKDALQNRGFAISAGEIQDRYADYICDCKRH